MELKPNINCYTDIAEANDLIASYFKSNDPVRVYWESIADETDKAAIILQSTMLFDNDDMLYKWFKQDINQPLQFPRIDVYKNIIEVPTEIKIGLLLQGIKADIETGQSEYTQLKAQGIKEYKIKDASVEFFEHIDNDDIETKKLSNGMYLKVYTQYFKKFCDVV